MNRSREDFDSTDMTTKRDEGGGQVMETPTDTKLEYYRELAIRALNRLAAIRHELSQEGCDGPEFDRIQLMTDLEACDECYGVGGVTTLGMPYCNCDTLVKI